MTSASICAMATNKKDIRWIQRFENYQKALIQLKNAVDLAETRALSDFEKQGLIQGFEFTHELAWNVMKDYFRHQGNQGIRGSTDATRAAFKNDIIVEGQIWMDMIEDRNQSTHTYNEEVAEKISSHILKEYLREFEQFSEVMEKNSKQS